MNSINDVMLSGNVTRDATVRETGDNKGWIKFGIAVSESYKKADGTFEKSTAFLDISWFSFGINHKAAMLTKGTAVMVKGKLKQETWEKNGVKNSKIVVQAFDVAMIMKGEPRVASKPDEQSAPSGAPANAPSNPDDENMPF